MDRTRQAASSLAEAVRGGRTDVDAVAHVVGASAAADGSGLGEVIDLVERAFDGAPRHTSVRAACLAWAERALGRVHETGCEDPLTSLSTVPHLHSRVEDVYRAAAVEEQRAGDGHVLLVVELAEQSCRSALEASLRALEVGQVLRSVFAGDEAVARVGPRRFAVLARRGATDATTLALVGVLLGRTPDGAGVPRLWVEELPPTLADVPGLLRALAS